MPHDRRSLKVCTHRALIKRSVWKVAAQWCSGREPLSFGAVEGTHGVSIKGHYITPLWQPSYPVATFGNAVASAASADGRARSEAVASIASFTQS